MKGWVLAGVRGALRQTGRGVMRVEAQIQGSDWAIGVKTWTEFVMSACPKDSSNTKLSSRRSGMCPPYRLFSCPPPRTLETEAEKDEKEKLG